MLYDDPPPYRWQDHVITPRRAAGSLMATLAVVAAGAVLMIATAGAADRPCLPHTPARHAVVSERTPPLSQLAKRPALPHGTRDLL
jgi:hypothetical protein